MYTVCALLLCVFSEVPLVGGSGGGWGSWLTAPICCSWPASKDSKQAGERERARDDQAISGACCPRWLVEHNSWCHKLNQSSRYNWIFSVSPSSIFLYLTHPASFQLLQLFILIWASLPGVEGVRLGGLTILSVLVADDVVVSASLSRDSQWVGGMRML